jgi:membrane-associated protease RseP (regulator of RpoE activity)
MSKGLIAILIVLAAGIAAGVSYLVPAEPATVVGTLAAAEPPPFNPSAAFEDRVAALETALEHEREARRILEDELIALFNELDRLKSSATPAVRSTDEPRPAPRSTQARDRESFETRSQALVQEGLSPERAAYILQRESELRFAQMQAYYEARNAENPEQRLAGVRDPDAALREEIGEAEYEQYLRANNRSTSVEVQGVMASSPAEAAGLKPGDEIVRYDGERVYNSRDLMERSMQGEGPVVVELVRNGAPMEVVIPRGPLGIEIGRRG